MRIPWSATSSTRQSTTCCTLGEDDIKIEDDGKLKTTLKLGRHLQKDKVMFSCGNRALGGKSNKHSLSELRVFWTKG